MKRLLTILVALAISESLPADDQVSVPWAEFKELYRESIEREIMKTRAGLLEGKEPLVYSIEEAVYKLRLSEERADGEVLISGAVISGETASIPLFGGDLVITGVKQVTGGILLSATEEAGGIAFLPAGSTNQFQLVLSFLARPREDGISKFVSFKIPSALKNSLNIDLPQHAGLLEDPGIVDDAGVYHFAATNLLNVRFVDRRRVSSAAIIDIDMLSRIRLQGNRAIITTAFVPVRPFPGSFLLRIRDEARYVSSSLKPSWIEKRENDSYEIRIPSGEENTFSIQFAVEESEEAGKFMLLLPEIEDNQGREGDFVLEEPDDGRISLAGKDLVSDMPAAKLDSRLIQAAGKDRFYSHISPGEILELTIKRFKPVDTAPVVLDSQYFFASFEEKGSVLSVLILELPPEIGPRLRLKSVPDTEIWALTVNGRKRRVYANDDGDWIIPLEDGETSRVQLALLRKGEKLGLQGRLEAVLPETGLFCRTVCVGIALPERVQLLSLEGPLNAAAGESWQTPAEFIGKPYFFSRSFYQGQGMKLAVSYKEPVTQTHN